MPSRVRALTGWYVERNGERVHVHEGDLLPANSPLLPGHEADVEPADFVDQPPPADANETSPEPEIIDTDDEGEA